MLKLDGKEIKLTWKTVKSATKNVSKLLAGRPVWKFHLKPPKNHPITPTSRREPVTS